MIRTIYRVENDLNIGPYHHRPAVFNGAATQNNPMPDSDGISTYGVPFRAKNGWTRNDYRFGFETMTALFNWFDHVNWLLELQRNEFHVVTMRVGDTNLIRGGRQLAYRERDVIVRPRRVIEWSHVFIAFDTWESEGRA